MENSSFENKMNEILEEYKKLDGLDKQYDSGEFNRKEIAKKMEELSKNITNSLEILKINLFTRNKKCRFPEFISEYRKILNVLLKLSNNKEDKYELIKYITRENKKDNYQNVVWIISEKSILNELDNFDIYDSKLFYNKLTKIINSGKSVVGITEFDSDYKLFPYDFDLSRQNVKVDRFKVNSLIGDLRCFTYDDELGKSIELLKKYIEVYSGDIDNMSIDTIINNMNSLEENNVQKVFKKID